MSILCGTDFSETSATAANVAACLAAHTHEALHLVYALDLPKESAQDSAELFAWANRKLAREGERLREVGAEVHVQVATGPADEALQTAARELSTRLIIIGAFGKRGGSAGNIGSHADRTAQRSHVPVLLVRDGDPFERWLSGERPLKVVFGVDASLSSENAGRWINELARFGHCDVVLSHLYWPPAEFHRIGLGGLRNYVDPDQEILRTLKHEYAERFTSLLGSEHVSYRIEPHLGRIGDGLASLAHEENADLVVVGCHDHTRLAMVWEGSVARQVLRCATTSVACIPAPSRPAIVHPTLDDVLAATDFSAHGDAAVALAYAMVSSGGTVHLVHVVNASHVPTEPYDIFGPAPSAALMDVEAAARSRLTRSIPGDAGARAGATRVHVLFSENPARAICQAAERLGVDAICMGTHGRTGLSKVIVGSVSAAVAENTERTLVLARAKRA